MECIVKKPDGSTIQMTDKLLRHQVAARAVERGWAAKAEGTDNWSTVESLLGLGSSATEVGSVNTAAPTPIVATSETRVSTTEGLDELKRIFNSTYSDGQLFAQAIRRAGYTLKERAPWGSSVVMERGDDKFIIDIQNGGVRQLSYRCERLKLSANLVVDGRKVF